MKAWRFVPNEKIYLSMTVSDHCKTCDEYEGKLDDEVICALCGFKTTWGDAFTSHLIYGPEEEGRSKGLVICSNCYQAEKLIDYPTSDSEVKK